MWHMAMSLRWARGAVKLKASRWTAVVAAPNLLVIVFSGIVLGGSQASADTVRDVQLIGLPPLYEALFAVANCPNVAVDNVRFVRAAALYHLSASELTSDGAFAAEIAELTERYRLRLDDDRDAFCSVNRLSFSIPYGILVDRGPVFPHPLPFGRDPTN